MGAPAFDSAAVLTRVRRDSFLARSDDNWTDQNILAIGHDCLISQFAPYMKTIKQDWFGEDTVIPLVGGQSMYDFPEEAMWNSVNAILLQNVGGSTPNTIARELGVVEPGTRALYEQFSQGVPSKFFMQQTQFVVLPQPDTVTAGKYQMLVPYYRRPAQMVVMASVTQATVVSSVSLTVTTSAQPSSFSGDTNDTFLSTHYVDVYSRKYPYTRKMWNAPCTIPSTTALTFVAPVVQASVTAINPGDVICAHSLSPYPDLPAEGHPALCKMICATIDLAQKDEAAFNTRAAAILGEFGAALRGLSNRQDGAPRKLSLCFAAASSIISATRQRWRGE